MCCECPTVLKALHFLSSALLSPYPRMGRSFICHRLAKAHFELMVLYFFMHFPYFCSLCLGGRGRDPFSFSCPTAGLLTQPLNSSAPSIEGGEGITIKKSSKHKLIPSGHTIFSSSLACCYVFNYCCQNIFGRGSCCFTK